jgi:membrane dipeptidase
LIIVDGHCDSIGEHVDNKRLLNVHSSQGHLDLPRLRVGGVTVQFFASFIEAEYKGNQAAIRGLRLVEGCRKLVMDNPEYLLLLSGYKTIEEALLTGRTAALLSVEGGEALGGNLFMLRVLYHLGVRALGLTWNNANDLAGGVAEPGGLTGFGREVVQEMNALGMLVDVSHLSDEAFWDVLGCSTQPVIASHSCCRSLREHPRNLSDEQIKALAAKGGLIGINFYTQFLKGASADLLDVIRHIEHVCELVGPDYVGIGSDFDGCESVPKGLEDVTKLPNLATALQKKGYKTADVDKIMGGNFFRVIKQVIRN